MKPLVAIHHIALKVRNLEICRVFYEDILGLKPCAETPATKHSIWLQLGQSILMLEESKMPAADSSPKLNDFSQDPAGWHLIGLAIVPNEREKWRKYLSDNKINIVHESKHTLYIQDPEGNRLGLSHFPA